MQSSQLRIEEVTSDNIVERELQPPKPPKRKKKKVPFAVWWELYATEEQKNPAENIKQQDASLEIEKESIAKAVEAVDQRGDRSTSESESNENQVPFKSWSEEHVPVEQRISARNIEKQNDSLLSAEESIARVEETINTSEKEQPSESREQPRKTRHNKKKKIPFNIWLEKHAPAESTGPQDASPASEKASISELQETNNLAEKQESFQSCAENVTKQDTSLPQEGDQADSLKKEICTDETPLVTDQDFISKAQETLDQQEEEQRPKMRRIKKKKIPFHIWLAKQAPPESTGPQDALPVSEKTSISELQETNNLAEKEESIQSCTEIVNKQDTSLPEDIDQKDFLKNKSLAEEPVISTAQMVSKNKSISQSETKVDQKVKKQMAKTKRIRRTPLLWKCFPESNACVDLTFLIENSDVNNSPSYQTALPCSDKKTFWKVLPESEPCIELNFLAEHIEDQDVSVLVKHGKQVGSLEKQPYSKHTLIATTNQAQCTCQGKCKEPELGSVELQKYLMRQLDEMFDINRKLSAKLNYQNDLLRKVLSEQRPNRKSTGWGHVWNE